MKGKGNEGWEKFRIDRIGALRAGEDVTKSIDEGLAYKRRDESKEKNGCGYI